MIVNAVSVEEIHASVFYPGGTYYQTVGGHGVRLVTTILLCEGSRKLGTSANLSTFVSGIWMGLQVLMGLLNQAAEKHQLASGMTSLKPRRRF
jgi:hypothetical protein